MGSAELQRRPPQGLYNAAVDLVDRNVAEGRGSKVVYADPSRQLTYAQLQERCNRFANALPRLGIGRERRIVMIMLDTVDWPVVFLGALKAGVVAVPINTLLTPEQWRYMIEDSRADAVIVSPELLDRAGPIVDAIAAERHLHVIVPGTKDAPGRIALEPLLASSNPEAEAARTNADETAFWLYSSGSTGSPKGTRHVHASAYWIARCYGQETVGIGENDLVFSAAKLFFAYGLGNSLWFPLSVGASVVLWPDRVTPDVVIDLCAKHNPTVLCCVPTLYGSLLASPRLTKGAGSNRLRLCLSAGEALPADYGTQWEEKVGTEIIDGLGSTEMLHIFCSNRPGHVTYGSSGKPIPGFEARIVDENDQPVPQGEIGELIVRGPTQAEAYWNQRDKTRRTFRGEWTYTGDKYRQDEAGNYYCCGRTDDMFKVSGIWVSPFEVESALLTHPAVLEAAVIGKEDSDGLLKPKAFVVLKGGAGDGDALYEQLKSHVKDKAGAWKYPRWVEVVPDLPKTATGKIQRFKLRERG